MQLFATSGSSLRVDWTPPLSDGGSQVTSYKVEWDTNPGVREIQTIKTSAFVGPNEVQQIVSSASHVDEVQVIRTTATEVFEVQEVKTVVDPGNEIKGFFSLTFDTSYKGGGPMTTAAIRFDAGASSDNTRTTMEEIIEALPNVEDVQVTSTTGVGGTRTWSITFKSDKADVPQLTVAASSLT